MMIKRQLVEYIYLENVFTAITKTQVERHARFKIFLNCMFLFGVKIGVMYNVKKNVKKLACCHWACIHAVHVVQFEISEWSRLNTGYSFRMHPPFPMTHLQGN